MAPDMVTIKFVSSAVPDRGSATIAALRGGEPALTFT